ncbi:MAG: radical SAM protein [Candidatus Omnitrophica bacterium]|nr:radical SAM protein [Candidatus Omnitrophota bacterium]
MKILAIIIPHSDRHSGDYSMLNFPIGMAYVIASVREKIKGASIVVSDFSVDHIVSEESIKDRLRSVSIDFKPDYVIYGSMITRFSYIKSLSRIIKEIFPSAKQVLGGSAAGSGYKFFLDDGIIDFLVAGEGEEAMVDILSDNWQNNPSIIGPGGRIVPEKRAIKDINSLPMPSYKDFNVKAYIDNNFLNTGWRYMPIITSRGCPFACNFCYPNFGNVVRLRSEDMVIDEIKYLNKNYGIEAVYFWDEIQFLNKEWVESFCRKLLDKKINIKWVCAGRASLLQKNDLSLLRLAKKAGCLRISIGIESGNQGILDMMNKNTKVKQIEDSIRIIRAAGIKATGTILAGYLGETRETLHDTIKFANRNLLKTAFCCLIPLPGSKIYDYCISKNLIKDEYAYLKKVSLEGGDASHIVFNLTKMDDQAYIREIGIANEKVGRIRLKSIFDYYGLGMGLIKYFDNLRRAILMRVQGRRFETM